MKQLLFLLNYCHAEMSDVLLFDLGCENLILLLIVNVNVDVGQTKQDI